MARSANTDPLMAYNFAILEVPVAGLFPFAFPIKTVQDALTGQAFVGFKSIDFPTVSVETVDIKEGNWPFVHKFVTGYVDSGEVKLEMALFPINTDMWVYFSQAIWGRVAPRRSFIVIQMRNDNSIQRAYWLEDCLPTSWTPSSGMDAQSSEVLMEDITLSVHRIRILPTPNPLVPINTPSLPTF
jgi:phage tail-like protein